MVIDCAVSNLDEPAVLPRNIAIETAPPSPPAAALVTKVEPHPTVSHCRTSLRVSTEPKRSVASTVSLLTVPDEHLISVTKVKNQIRGFGNGEVRTGEIVEERREMAACWCI